jgi:mono/diheme cytochrome c family protein
MGPSARRFSARVATGIWSFAAGILSFATGAICWCGSSAAAEGFGSEVLPAPAALEVFRSQVRPLLAQYCFRCHGGADPKGDLALDGYQEGGMLVADYARWRTIAERLRDGDMPPDGEARPDDAQLESLVVWIERQVAAAEHGRTRDPGRVTMRRLNRAEYNNTIRDLIGLDFHAADDFPADDVGYGFDNNGDVLSLPPLLMEKYLTAAQTIAEIAIMGQPAARPLVDVDARHATHHGEGRPFGDSAWQFYSGGELSIDIPVLSADEYRIGVKAYGQQAGPDPARMEVHINGGSVAVVDVTATRSAPQTYEVRARLASGKQRLTLAFINDYYEPENPPNQRDRNLVIEAVRVEGRSGADGSKAETRRRIIFRDPTPETEPATARDILAAFASRAFRRPAQPVEVDRLMKLYDVARGHGDNFNEAIRLAVEAVLVSPQFLFRLELDPPAPSEAVASQAESVSGGAASDDVPVRTLGDYELASRLSYFLWSSMPDDELMAAAAAGRLHAPAEVAAQARRMLTDAKSRAFVENFSGQWLELRRLDQLTPSKKIFPGFDHYLGDAMREETERFVAAIVAEDRSVLDLLDADFTFVNERLARHYGIEGVSGKEFRRVQLTGQQRGGLLTQGSILTLTSNPNRTSPVKRGRWVMENLLGGMIPNPPPDAPPLPETPEAIATGSLRQRMEQHRSNAQCATCHARMDPIGFGLENFDAVGVWRTEEGGVPIDASGTVGGQAFSGPAEFKERLRAKPARFTRCLAEKLLTYALGRGVESFDRPALAEIVERTTAGGWRFSSLVEAVVQSDPFLKCRTTGGTP